MSSRPWLCTSASSSNLPESIIISLFDSFGTDMWVEVITGSKYCLAASWPLSKTHETAQWYDLAEQSDTVCLLSDTKKRLTYIDTEWQDLSQTIELVFVSFALERLRTEQDIKLCGAGLRGQTDLCGGIKGTMPKWLLPITLAVSFYQGCGSLLVFVDKCVCTQGSIGCQEQYLL